MSLKSKLNNLKIKYNNARNVGSFKRFSLIILNVIIFIDILVILLGSIFGCSSTQNQSQPQQQLNYNNIIMDNSPTYYYSSTYQTNFSLHSRDILQAGEYFIDVPTGSSCQIDQQAYTSDHVYFSSFPYNPCSMYYYQYNDITNNVALPCSRLWFNTSRGIGITSTTSRLNNVSISNRPSNTLFRFKVVSPCIITSLTGTSSLQCCYYPLSSSYYGGDLTIAYTGFLKSLDFSPLQYHYNLSDYSNSVPAGYNGSHSDFVKCFNSTYVPSLPIAIGNVQELYNFGALANYFDDKVYNIANDIIMFDYLTNTYYDTLSFVLRPLVFKSSWLGQCFVIYVPYELRANSHNYMSVNSPNYLTQNVEIAQTVVLQNFFDSKFMIYSNARAYIVGSTSAHFLSELQKHDYYYFFNHSENIQGSYKYEGLYFDYKTDVLDEQVASLVYNFSTLLISSDNGCVSFLGKTYEFPCWTKHSFNYNEFGNDNILDSLFNMLQKAFTPVFSFFSIQIAPNIYVGTLLLTPCLLALILFLIKLFRGL